MNIFPREAIQEILNCCVHERGLTSPVTVELTDVNGELVSARYYDDRDPELIEGDATTPMQAPFAVFAFDNEGHTAAFTIPVFEIGMPPTIH